MNGGSSVKELQSVAQQPVFRFICKSTKFLEKIDTNDSLQSDKDTGEIILKKSSKIVSISNG